MTQITMTKNSLKDFDIEQLDAYEITMYFDLRLHSTKEQALQILINNCEGDYSQLSEGLAEIAREYSQD